MKIVYTYSLWYSSYGHSMYAWIVLTETLPLIVSALAKNSNDEEGASSLLGALQDKHDGSLLDNIGGFLKDSGSSDGLKILGHVLGGRQNNIISSLSKLSGMESSKTGQILALLAPIVMAALSRKNQEKGNDSSSLQEFLQGEKESVESKDPESTSFLNNLLDSDNDGSISDDMVNIGAKLLKGFF